jgi:rod shape-determining protein MreD
LRNAPLFWLVALLLPILHFLLHVGLGWGAWSPDLLTVGLLLVAREVRAGTAAAAGFVLGLMEDAFSILAFGANAMALTILGILGARSRDLFVGESVVFMVSYLLLGTWLRHAIHWLVAGGEGRADVTEALLVQAPVAAIYAATVGILLILVTGTWPGGVSR